MVVFRNWVTVDHDSIIYESIMYDSYNLFPIIDFWYRLLQKYTHPQYTECISTAMKITDTVA